jgi:NAD(P)-dependent dehydrogenase (short-subunit alcohol dehydrogenase family)
MRTIQQLFDLTGKTALVTGGSRGLGLQIAEALGEQGASVVLSARKQAELDEAVAYRGRPGARRPRIIRSKRGTR